MALKIGTSNGTIVISGGLHCEMFFEIFTSAPGETSQALSEEPRWTIKLIKLQYEKILVSIHLFNLN